MDTLELTTEFGTLNFEDIVPDITEDPIEEPDIAIEEIEEELRGSEFEKEMQKVIGIMKIAGNDLPVRTIKTLMTDLVLKAKDESETEQEEEERLREVGTLVTLFRANNAQRAKESFDERKPKNNPVQEELEEISDQIENGGGRDLNKILEEKAKQRPEVVQDFKDLLQVPKRTKPRMHVKQVAPNFSDILINKAKLKPDNVKDFDSGLDVPKSIEATPNPEETTQGPPTTEDFSQILIEKSKLKPELIKDFDAGLDLPILPDAGEDFGETPEFVPATTLKPRVLVNLTQLLSIPSTKEMIEDHIMDMIIENPERAAADLSELFDIQNSEEKETTEEELFEMMEEDPLAVTSAFTDLIMAQKEEPISTSTPAVEPTTQAFDLVKTEPTTPFNPVKIEEVPDEVKGQMQRMTAKPENIPDVTTLKPLEVSTDLLNDMMKLIEEGQLSHKEVIQELINNGVLPVEVTQIGSIPIIVGGRVGTNVGKSQPLINIPQVPRRPQPRKEVKKSQPLIRIPQFSSRPKPREEVNLERLQQLKADKPKMIMRDEHHIMQEVGLDDPDGDFEMVKLPPRKALPLSIKPELSPVSFLIPIDEEEEVADGGTTEEKDIEILASMMDLFDQGLISDEELEQMVIMMESEGVLDVDLQELGIEKLKKPEEEEEEFKEGNRYRAYGLSSDTFGEGPSVGQPDPFFNKQTIKPFSVGVEPQATPPTYKSESYAHFSMQTPTAGPIPPELPPPSTESLHKAPYFDEQSPVYNTGYRHPDHFEHEFKKTNLDFKPQDLPKLPHSVEEIRSGPNPEFGIRPGPAPPYYMSARLPAPQHFQHHGGSVGPAPFLDHEVDHFKVKKEPEFDIYKPSSNVGPREPFPPPFEFKKHVHHQPLPLILSDEGSGYKHPHFDIPSSLINPKAYMKSLKSPHIPDHLHHHHSPNQFLPRKGRLNFDDFQTTLRSKRKINKQILPPVYNPSLRDINSTPIYNPPVTGYSQVDRKFDEIRQSYIRGDSLGSGASHFKT